MDTTAVMETKIPIIYLHFTIKLGSKVVQSVPRDYNTFAYVLNGIFGNNNQVASKGQIVLFRNEGE